MCVNMYNLIEENATKTYHIAFITPVMIVRAWSTFKFQKNQNDWYMRVFALKYNTYDKSNNGTMGLPISHALLIVKYKKVKLQKFL